MKPETAQKLIELIQSIDTDNPNDFVELVCSKREELPESVIDELKEIAGQVEYGCYCDLEEGMNPGDCVLDEGLVHDCVYAPILIREGKTKTDCKYWKPITFNAGIK